MMKFIRMVGTILALLVLSAGVWAGCLTAEETEEALWDNCDSLNVIAPIYGQPVWDPKSFKTTRIGTVTVDTEEKIEGKGSIHWVVTKKNVDDMKTKNPTFNSVAIHKLYGQDWSPYLELKFSIKCENPKHPPVACLLYGIGKFPSRGILKENEVTKGWKEITWDLRKVDTGTDPKWGKIMNYFRIFTNAGSFKEGDTLDLYIDNMRLVTVKPQEN